MTRPPEWRRAFACLYPAVFLYLHAAGVNGVGGVKPKISGTAQSGQASLSTSIRRRTRFTFGNIVSGLVKSLVFATLITQIVCLQGFRVKSSPHDVGRDTTSTVVKAIFLVILV